MSNKVTWTHNLHITLQLWCQLYTIRLHISYSRMIRSANCLRKKKILMYFHRKQTSAVISCFNYLEIWKLSMHVWFVLSMQRDATVLFRTPRVKDVIVLHGWHPTGVVPKHNRLFCSSPTHPIKEWKRSMVSVKKVSWLSRILNPL